MILKIKDFVSVALSSVEISWFIAVFLQGCFSCVCR